MTNGLAVAILSWTAPALRRDLGPRRRGDDVCGPSLRNRGEGERAARANRHLSANFGASRWLDGRDEPDHDKWVGGPDLSWAAPALRRAMGPRLRGDDVCSKGCALSWRHSRGGGSLGHRAAQTTVECVAAPHPDPLPASTEREERARFGDGVMGGAPDQASAKASLASGIQRYVFDLVLSLSKDGRTSWVRCSP